VFLIAILLLIYLVFFKNTTKKKYDDRIIKKGKEVANHTKLIIATCVRNAEKAIENIVCLYNKFNCIFQEVKFVTLENDSTDKTRKQLLELKNKSIPDMDIVGCGLDQDICLMKLNNVREGASKERVRRMAKIRNILLNNIKNIQKDYDYCLLFDGDLEVEEMDENGIFDTMYHLDKDKSIDAIVAYTYIDYGDVFTRSYDPFAYKTIKGPRIFYLSDYFKDGLIKVKSAFNGFVFYRLPFSDEIKYNEDTNTCEHIEFNEQLKNMYINTNFMIEISKH